MRLTIITLSFLFSSLFSIAGIVYVDITDKYFVEGSSLYSLNLDGNSGQDIWFSDQTWNAGTLSLSLDFSGGSYHNFDGSTEVMPITSGTMIGSNPNWTTNLNVQMNTPWANTPFPSGVDRYIGIKTGNSIYAWLRVQYTPQALIIKDYAYENTGQPISAGDKGIVAPPNYYLRIESINGPGVTTVPESQFMQFKVFFMPDDIDLTTAPSITWSVINAFGQATIDSEGLLHAIQQGGVRVRAVHSNSIVSQGLLDITIGPYAASLEDEASKAPVIVPNPATDKLMIFNAEGFDSFQIISLDGRVCLEKTITSSIHNFDLENLKSGNYICILEGQRKKETLKLIVN